MLGRNIKRKPIFGNGNILEVKNIFKTIQGEGPLVGMPAIFVRLGGCNLACEFCDTDFEDFDTLDLPQVISKVTKLADNTIKLVVITGGEPFRQPIEKLCEELIAHNFMVQIETNGTIYRNIPEEVMIICSPKTTQDRYHDIHPDLMNNLSAIKFLISTSLLPYNNIADIGQTKYNIPTYIQPMDQYDPILNAANVALAIKIAISNNYRLSLQLHKILNIE